MLSSLPTTTIFSETKFFGTALVLEINIDEELILLQINDQSNGEIEVWAKSALPVNHKFQLGESVLVISGDLDKHFIIGVLDSKSISKNEKEILELENGTTASIEKNLHEEKLKVNSKSGELIFEYDSTNGKSKINVEKGDLEFETNQGNINFISGGNISLKSKQSLQIESKHKINLQTTNSIGEKLSSLDLNSKKMKLESADINLNAKQSHILIAETKFIGSHFSGRIKNVNLVMGKLESAANTVIEKAENIYKTVKGLTQLKSGRMRTIVKSTFHLKGENVNIKAEKDFKVKGDKIHLG